MASHDNHSTHHDSHSSKRGSHAAKSGHARKASSSRSAGGSRSASHGSKPSHGSHSSSGGRSRHLSHTSTDHNEIRKWAEARHAQPACVKGTGGNGDPGMIRLDFPGFAGKDSLQHISWDEWFEAFDDNDLALVYQEKTADGERSNFNKLVSRDRAD